MTQNLEMNENNLDGISKKFDHIAQECKFKLYLIKQEILV